MKRMLSMLAAIALASTASAATDTDNLSVTATVPATCEIDASDSLGFGNYDPSGANRLATQPLPGDAVITIRCNAAGDYVVGFGPGLNVSGEQRRMSGPTTLNYDLCRDAACTDKLGVAANQTITITSTGSGVAATATLYGEIPGGQNVPAGAYSDTVVATVNF
jgi:spore coat protein U-like protein